MPIKNMIEELRAVRQSRPASEPRNIDIKDYEGEYEKYWVNTRWEYYAVLEGFLYEFSACESRRNSLAQLLEDAKDAGYDLPDVEGLQELLGSVLDD